MQDPIIEQYEQRKRDHIDLALQSAHQTTSLSYLDRITLIHEALPDLNFEDIDISGLRFGKKTKTPFLVSSMTGGHQQSTSLNHIFAEACHQQGWALGVGSQRRQLFDKSARQEWETIRAKFPDLTLLGNIGIAQLIETDISVILELTTALAANGLIIHTNPLQECLQPEGTPQFRGGMAALEQLCKQTSLPIVVKETGCGFSKNTLARLNALPISAVELSGLGGTHWGRIEGARHASDTLHAKAAETFKNWGIPTIVSLNEGREIQPKYELWASGGVRTGLDAAKLLAMGAHTIGLAQPILRAALAGRETLLQIMQQIEFELKVALFLTGCENIPSLQSKQVWQWQTL